jgi:hypothetical protein
MDREFFRNPVNDPDYTTSGFWFWNDLITDDKTSGQLNMMKAIHANQPVVHARFGLKNEYLSQDWFDRIKSAIETCRKNEQKIWLYDENNWPSGNCNWTITLEEEYREHYLQFDRMNINAGETYEVSTDEKNYINITAYDNHNKSMDLLTEVKDRKITFSPIEPMEIYAVYVAVDEYEPVGKFCVDYLSKAAIRKFIDSTHEKYAEQFSGEFGKVISGIFMDETRFCNANPWTETLPEEFKKRKGYDLIPYLPLLRKKNEQSALFCYDYYDVISDMYTEATYKQIYDWCEEKGIKTTGHFLGEETIATQSYFGGDMLRGYKYFHVPAIDHLGNGIGSLNGKFAASASYAYGKTRIGCEAYGASGWDITFEDMVRISNWLFQQGINLIWMHGFYYSIEGERFKDFPPSYFYQWKYWDLMPMYIKMSNRMQKLLSDGRHEAEILVYTPIESFWNHYEPDLSIKTGFWKEGPWIRSGQAKFIDNQHQLICNKLIDKNLDFDIFHADAVENFEVTGNKLVNKLLGIEYEVFILPTTEMLTEGVVQLLNEFTAAGGKVISFKSDVKYVVSKGGGHMRGIKAEKLATSKFIKALKISDIIEECKKYIKLPFDITCGVDEISHSLSSYPARLIDPYIHDGERLYGVGVTRYIKEDKRILNFTNYNEKEEDLTVCVKSTEIPELFIPETGEIVSIMDYVKKENSYEFSFTLPQNRACFIVCSL